MFKRKINRGGLITGLTICFSFCSLIAASQSIQAFTDKKDILIGEQINLKIKATFQPSALRLKSWFSLTDTIPHFEIVEAGRIDTINYKDNSRAFEQTLIVTSFDSGEWTFPALPIKFDDLKSNKTADLFTDPFEVNVSYSPPDSTNQLRDIKPIIEVKTGPDYFRIVLWSALALLLIIIIVLLIRKYGKKELPIQFSGKLSPYDEAMQELEKLNSLNLEDPADIKQFHSRLAAVFKWYISRRQRFTIMNKTTGDVLVYLAEKNVAKDTVAETATVLRCGDAVKFAKFQPTAIESNECLDKIRSVINSIQPQTKKQ